MFYGDAEFLVEKCQSAQGRKWRDGRQSQRCVDPKYCLQWTRLMGHILCPRRINAVQFLTCVRGAVDICTPALTVDICGRLYAAERVTYAPL